MTCWDQPKEQSPKPKQQWIEKIELLYHDEVLREEFSMNCQKDAYNYSIQKYFPIYKGFIDLIFDTLKT